MKKYSYTLKNLECANCAAKIQRELEKQDDMKNVVVNFNTLKLNFESDNKDVKAKVIQIVGKIEPEVEVLDQIQINSEKDSKSKINVAIFRLAVGIILSVIGFYINLPWHLNEVIIIVAYVILLYRTSKNAAKLLVKSKTINENLLITISSIGAYLVGENMEGLMVIILYEIGKILEEKAINKSRASISDLMNIKPEYANLKVKENYEKVNPDKVKIGDSILVKQGEKVPLDGKIIDGSAKLDMAALTGESNYVSKSKGEEVLSGSIIISGMLTVEVTNEYQNSTVNKILELVENATDKKAKTETFVAKAARIYTPVVLILAIIVTIFMPLIFDGVTFSESIYRALIFLVISCPCAIAISVPLSYFSGIGRASKEGILIKGSDYLDGLKDIKEIVFDKTGTLTTGKFEIVEIISLDSNFSKEEILDLIAKAEKFSNHPIAKSVLEKIDYELDVKEVVDFKEIPGKGLRYSYKGNEYKVGNWGEENKQHKADTIVHLIMNDKEKGYIVIKDKIKEEAKQAIAELNTMGIITNMYTGDNELVAKTVADEIGIKYYKSGMLPQDKYHEMENLLKKQENKKVAFVGDGINDSPVLALADVGISMGGVGQQAAIEASDVVIMIDNISKIIDAIKISKKTVKIIKQNLIFAIATKLIVLLLSALGIAGMWQAVFADVGVTLITILNTLRILKK